MYRLYVDETGSTGRTTDNNPDNRFLSVTGVAMHLTEALGLFNGNYNRLRAKHFGHSSAKPVIIHRRRIIAREGVFKCLEDEAQRAAWDADLLAFIGKAAVSVITVVVDKVAFYHQHPNWREEPYSLALFNLLERYFYFLRGRQTSGDIWIETRNPKQDDIVQAEYQKFRTYGTRYILPNAIQERMPRDKMMFCIKQDDVTGIQFADLIARPCHSACRFLYTGIDEFTPYSRIVARTVWPKFYRSKDGKVDGHGNVWRPKGNGPRSGAARAIARLPSSH